MNATDAREMKRELSVVLAEMEARFTRVRAGVDVGFTDAGASQTFRVARGGAWMTVETTDAARDLVAAALGPQSVLALGAGGELPFEDRQFDVVILARGLMKPGPDAALVRECHRVLRGGGCLFFSVAEQRRETPEGYTERRLYELLRDGFDVLAVHRPPWWLFGQAGHPLTVCARRKTWRSRAARIVTESTPVSDAMLFARS